MKKNKIFFLLLFPLMLTGCTSSDPVALPNKGTDISSTEGKAKLKQSYDASVDSKEGSSDAFEISLSNVSFSIDANLSAKDSEGNETSPYAKLNFQLTDLSISLGMKGLTSTNADDIKGYMGIEFTLAFDYEADMSRTSLLTNKVSSKFEKKKYAINAYFDKTAFYLDLSNENVLNLIKDINKNNPTFSIGSGKYYIDSPFDESDLPLLKKSDADTDTYAKIESSFLNMDSEGSFKSHGNDIYSYSYSIDGKKLSDQVKKQDIDTDFTGSQSISTLLNFTDSLSIDSSSKLDYTLIFNTTKGISSIGYKEDLKLNYKNDYTNMSGTITSSSSAKLSFNYGNGISIKEINDKSSYQKFTMEI